MSAAKELAEGWNVPIYAHPLDFPYLTGREEYPKPNVNAGGDMMTFLSPLYPREPIDVGNRLIALVEESDAGNTPGRIKLQIYLSSQDGRSSTRQVIHLAMFLSFVLPIGRCWLETPSARPNLNRSLEQRLRNIRSYMGHRPISPPIGMRRVIRLGN